ncbi:MAG: ABC transporter permease [Chloroflexi bacterium]|nr:ABC transporter permease [Chloroflexota bacterium]
MLKTFLIGLKDLRLAFRDRAALLLMLLAPFLLTIGMGFVTGRFSGGTSGISDIPVILVNQDNAQLGNALVDLFNAPELADLMEPTASSDLETARQLIDNDETAAVVFIPKGFTESIIPKDGQTLSDEIISIEIYTNPTRPTSAGIVQTIVEEFLSRVESGSIGGQVTMAQLITSGRVAPQDIPAVGEAMSERLSSSTTEPVTAIKLKQNEVGGEAIQFDVLAYLAPGMALMFLMYTVSYGGRTIIAERIQGTLPRLLISPTSAAQILGGKIFGIYLTGVAQLGILIFATTMMFQLKWGNTLGVIVLVLAAVFGATGWGMLITALARTAGQVASVGSAIMLIFGILGGSFVSLENLHPLMQNLSKITPNAWGLDGFTTLALGGGLADISTPVSALLLMGAVLFIAAVLLFNRQGIAQR